MYRAVVLNGAVLFPRGHWAMSGVLSSHNCGLGCSGAWQVDARSAPPESGLAPHGCGAEGSEPSVQTHGLSAPDGEGGWLDTTPPSCGHSLLSPQNPDIVLVHYLNVPAIEDCGKPCGPILCSINTDKKEWAKWTKEELIGQLKPMCE